MNLIVRVLLSFWLLSLLACASSTESILREGVIPSPEKTKSIEFINPPSSGINTQLLVNFEKGWIKGSAGVFAINALEEELVVKWIDEEHLWVEYPAQKEFHQQNDTLQSFKERLYVQYQSYDSCQIIEAKTIGIMDTVTAFVNVELVNATGNPVIWLVDEQEKKISAKVVNPSGIWSGVHVPHGKYKIMVEGENGKCYSRKLLFESGAIKKVKIMRK
ncbi:hypothetical protein [Haliscomenobacter sp.]|uniref:hypothetical protein n=1 Tax=Haliscomenobacter sp. TaxID=2717303 RepID=UPI0035945D27